MPPNPAVIRSGRNEQAIALTKSRDGQSSRFEAREFGLEFEAELFRFVVRQPLRHLREKWSEKTGRLAYGIAKVRQSHPYVGVIGLGSRGTRSRYPHVSVVPRGLNCVPMSGRDSIRVNNQWRLVFQWDGSSGEAEGIYLDGRSYR